MAAQLGADCCEAESNNFKLTDDWFVAFKGRSQKVNKCQTEGGYLADLGCLLWHDTHERAAKIEKTLAAQVLEEQKALVESRATIAREFSEL